MGSMFSFALMMLKREYKKSIFYTLTIIFAITMSFVFFNIMNNEYLITAEITESGQTWDQVIIPLSTMISFLIIVFCCYMILFATNFFISKKTKEFACLAVSGTSSVKLTGYLMS
ncbi:MAG: ABC transporter permease, partial [Coprobacillaceae bacterium]